MIQSIPIQSSIDLEPLRAFTRERIIPGAGERDQADRFASELYVELHRMGWFQAFIPAQLGGMGLSAPEMACVIRTLAAGSMGVAGTLIANMLGMSPIILYARPALRDRLCAQALERYTLWSYAMTEPDTGTDIVNTRTRARKRGSEYVISGSKCFITNASHSENLVVFARTADDGEKRRALSAFYVPAGTPGLSRGKALRKLGQRESDTAELYFDEMRVPEEHLIGAEGDGLKIAFRSLQRSKMLISAAAVGMCDRAFELARDRLAQRVLYGKPLLEQPMIATLLAQLHTEAAAGWLLTCLAAATWDTGDFAIKEASMAKLHSTHTAVKVMNEVLELFGGYGVSREYEIERLYRDVKILEIAEGPTFVQQLLVAKELFEQQAPRAASPIRKAA